MAERKRIEQEARKREAEKIKLALAEKKRIDQEARKKEIEEARKKAEEEARVKLNNAIAQNLQQEEESRQKAWEEHMQKVEMGKQQPVRGDIARVEAQRVLDLNEKKRMENMQHKRHSGEGSNNTSRAPFKKPRKESMFDYLKGPPPGCY
jgi:polycystin 1L2